ncbi:MAG: type IV pilin protein [Lysobacteraceae bacterium]
MGQGTDIAFAGGYSTRPRRRVNGFTLIEVMIVVAIVAVLAGIAYSSYTNQLIQGRRATAGSCLIEMSQILERRYTSSFSYAGAQPQPACRNDLANFYNFDVTLGQRTFALAAVPFGTQARDNSRCGTLGINQAGARTVSGPDPVERCW